MTDQFEVWAKNQTGTWDEKHRFNRLLSAENYAFGWMEDCDDMVEIRHDGQVVMRGQHGCARNYAPYNDIINVWCDAGKTPIDRFCADCKCQGKIEFEA